jgi:hypothetical protein
MRIATGAACCVLEHRKIKNGVLAKMAVLQSRNRHMPGRTPFFWLGALAREESRLFNHLDLATTLPDLKGLSGSPFITSHHNNAHKIPAVSRVTKRLSVFYAQTTMLYSFRGKLDMREKENSRVIIIIEERT